MTVVVRAAEREEYKISAFILGVVTSDPFRMARSQTASPEEASQVSPEAR